TLIQLARERLIVEQNQVSLVLVQLAQPGLEPNVTTVGAALEQHLAVADDVVERRVQLAPQMTQRCAVGRHTRCPCLSNVSIISSSRGRSIGLVSKSSHPAASAFSRSPGVV